MEKRTFMTINGDIYDGINDENISYCNIRNFDRNRKNSPIQHSSGRITYTAYPSPRIYLSLLEKMLEHNCYLSGWTKEKVQYSISNKMYIIKPEMSYILHKALVKIRIYLRCCKMRNTHTPSK